MHSNNYRSASRSRGFGTFLVALLVVAPLGLAAFSGSATADSTVVTGARMRDAAHAAATWTGDSAVVFGGVSSTGALLDVVQVYDPHRDVAGFASATLPSPRAHAAAAFDGASAFVVGGTDATGGLADIVRYDPVADTMTTLAVTLPFTAPAPSAVWTGSEVLVFSNVSVASFDPATETLTLLDVTLPFNVTNGAAAWNGSRALVVGESGVLAFDPATASVTTLDVTLPSARSHASAVATEDGTLLVLGGIDTDGGAALDDVLVLAPGADAFTVSDAPLPTPRYGTAAAWTGEHAYLFGHASPQTFNAARQIVRVDLQDRVTDGSPVQVRVDGAGSYEYWYGVDAGDLFVWGGARSNVRWDVGSFDGDFFPDDAESTLCDVEDASTPVDGQCANGNYQRPSQYGLGQALLP